MPAASSEFCTRSRKDVHCEKATARLPAAMSSRSKASNSLILVLCAASPPSPADFSSNREGNLEAPGNTFRFLRCRAPVRRHTGHSAFHSEIACSAHSRQKMWPHGVRAGSTGASQQIGQSGSSPFRSSSRRFPTNLSDAPFSPDISLRHRFSRLPRSPPPVAASRAKTRNGWQSACRSFRMSCRMCVYFESASPWARNVSNCILALVYRAS
mmetsp:Transcript_76006/g.198234  ORF Transcript_76006/g.198234 Transcript_76006/m.198234 type:complete len:212 (-) Transcript_76006:147-782(-)